MSTETIPSRAATKSHRVDSLASPAAVPARRPMLPAALLTVIVSGFIVLGGGSLEPSDADGPLGLAAGESLAPFAQVFGSWDPTLAVGKVLASQCWAWLEGGIPSTGAIRWPSALAAIAIGLLMARRLAESLGSRAGVLAALAILGTLGMVDRSASLGIDTLAGLGIVGALDRALSKGSDWTAGLWSAGAVLLGGWPALAVIVLAVVVIGRSGGSLSLRLVAPPIAAFLGWSIWALTTAPAEVWAAALTWPVTRPPAWSLGPRVIACGLPWAPLAILAAWPTIRKGWGEKTRGLVLGWLQVAAVGLLAGTLIPGLAAACAVPILVGMAVAAAAGLDRAWAGGLEAGPRRTVTILACLIGLGWGALAVSSGAYMAAAQPYFRVPAFVLLILGLATGLMALDAAWIGSTRGAVRALVLVAVGIKIAHDGVYTVEMNYRFGKGPWGRAVGQYVPPKWPIYTVTEISPALAFATEHPVRRLRSEIHLKAAPGNGPKFVLLALSEFEHWPELAPRLIKVRAFEDEYGGIRVLARTEGQLLRGPENEQ